MPLFVIRPDPNGAAGESRVFALAEAQRSKQVAEMARRRLESLQQMHSNDDDDNADWQAQTELCRAEEQYEAAQARHNANLAKLTWENERQWCKNIKRDLQASRDFVRKAAESWFPIFTQRKVSL